MNRRKHKAEIVPNDDETQCDSPPTKKRLNECEYRADEDSYNIFEPNSQNLDQYKDDEVRDTLKTIEFTESSTQTYGNAEENIKKMEFANNAFGTFVGLELANVPVLKRRYVMYQIIKIIENNS